MFVFFVERPLKEGMTRVHPDKIHPIDQNTVRWHVNIKRELARKCLTGGLESISHVFSVAKRPVNINPVDFVQSVTKRKTDTKRQHLQKDIATHQKE